MKPSNSGSPQPYSVWWQNIDSPNQFGTGIRDGFGMSSKIATAAAAVALVRYLGRK